MTGGPVFLEPLSAPQNFTTDVLGNAVKAGRTYSWYGNRASAIRRHCANHSNRMSGFQTWVTFSNKHPQFEHMQASCVAGTVMTPVAMRIYKEWHPTDATKRVLEDGVSVVEVTLGADCKVTSLGCTL